MTTYRERREARVERLKVPTALAFDGGFLAHFCSGDCAERYARAAYASSTIRDDLVNRKRRCFECHKPITPEPTP